MTAITPARPPTGGMFLSCCLTCRLHITPYHRFACSLSLSLSLGWDGRTSRNSPSSLSATLVSSVCVTVYACVRCLCVSDVVFVWLFVLSIYLSVCLCAYVRAWVLACVPSTSCALPTRTTIDHVCHLPQSLPSQRPTLPLVAPTCPAPTGSRAA